MSKIKRFLTNPEIRFNYLVKLGLLNMLPDDLFLKMKYKSVFGHPLNLDSPKTFNEKLQWLKLHDRQPVYTTLVDKYKVKEYISDILGLQYIIPTLGVWKDPDEIDFDSLPDRFVLKCNHNSGVGLYICKDKSKLDKEKVKSELRKGLKQNYYLSGREWPYKDVPRRIIAEKYMEDETGGFTDYKFFCFNGKVDCVMVCLDRYTGDTKFYFFDKDWKLKRLNKRGKAAPEGFTIPKPECMDQMFEIAAKLSEGLAFVRVDLYQSCGQIYFGELTFYPDSGFDANILPESDLYFGKLINLQSVKKGGLNK